MRVIGLVGGSFDPVHVAHLALADAFATALRLDEVRFLPAARPWQKNALSAAPAARLAMLDLALATHRAAHGGYAIDARELERDGPTFTIDTLRELRGELGDRVSLVFLFGADQLVHLDTWKDWLELWRYAHLAAVTRPGFDVATWPAAVERAWSERSGDVDSIHREAGRAQLLARRPVDGRRGDRHPGGARDRGNGHVRQVGAAGPALRSRLY